MLYRRVFAPTLIAALSVCQIAFAQAPVVKDAKPGAKQELKAAMPIDINTATVAQLQGLKGVGDKRAADIVKGRPYKGKDELVQKKILPQNVYDGIKNQIIAKQK